MKTERPILTVFYDKETGELTRVELARGFSKENVMMTADVLGDVKAQIDALYLRAKRDLRDRMREISRSAAEAKAQREQLGL